MTKIRFS